MTTHTRRLDGIVPLSEVANIFCALGEHPTNKDIRNISSECRHCVEDAERSCERRASVPASLTGHGIDFDNFLKLYLNHRSNSAPNDADIQKAFSDLEKFNGGHKLTPRFLESLLASVRNASPVCVSEGVAIIEIPSHAGSLI